MLLPHRKVTGQDFITSSSDEPTVGMVVNNFRVLVRMCVFIMYVLSACEHMYRAGQNCIYTPYMTVYLVVFLPKKLYI